MTGAMMIVLTIVAAVVGLGLGHSQRHLVAVVRWALCMALLTMTAGIFVSEPGIRLFVAAVTNVGVLQLFYMIALCRESRLRPSMQTSPGRREG